MTASDSSSSGTSRSDPAKVDLLTGGLLPALAAALVAGNDATLLEPLQLGVDEARLSSRRETVDRDLAEALGRTNASHGHSRAAELAGRLVAPDCLVVVAGQQPGLLGGPLYSLYKAIAVARWAERLGAATGRPAVGLFWVATEDHDFREVARATVFGREGPFSVDLGVDAAPLVPVGMRALGGAVERVLAELGEAVPGERYAEWIETLAGWYRPEARLGEAFAKLLIGLLGERSPLLVDAMLPELKRAMAPRVEKLIATRAEWQPAMAERAAEIVRRGYRLQVRPQPDASPLFVLHGGQRRRVLWRDDNGVKLRGADDGDHSIAWLRQMVADNPGAISPGVLARPALQDAVFGTALHVVGPGELSYLPQAAPLYEALGSAAPQVVLRPIALVLEERQLGRLETSGLSLWDLVAPEFDVDRALAAADVDDLVGPATAGIHEVLEHLGEAATAVDANLASPFEKTRRQIARALETFSGKLAAAISRRDRERRRRVEELRAVCRPLGTPQERIVAVAHFPGKHGTAFTDAVWDGLELESDRLQVIRL